MRRLWLVLLLVLVLVLAGAALAGPILQEPLGVEGSSTVAMRDGASAQVDGAQQQPLGARGRRVVQPQKRRSKPWLLGSIRLIGFLKPF